MPEKATIAAIATDTAIAASEADEHAATGHGRGEAGHRRQQHAAVEREVDDAGLLADRLADRGVDRAVRRRR